MTLDWARSPLQSGSPGAAKVTDVARVSRAVEPNPTSKYPLYAPGHFSSQVGKVSPVSSRSFKEALLSSKNEVQKVEASCSKTDEIGVKKIIKLSYVEQSTKDWMARSVVCKRRLSSDVGIIQQQIQDFVANIRVHPFVQTFYFVCFSDEETRPVLIFADKAFRELVLQSEGVGGV